MFSCLTSYKMRRGRPHRFSKSGIIYLASLIVPKDRLVGVLTKCDMLRDNEVSLFVLFERLKLTRPLKMSRKVVRLATGREVNPLSDTWFVAHNGSGKEDRTFSRAQAGVQLFNKSSWNEIYSKRREITMLWKHLSNLLSQNIHRSSANAWARIPYVIIAKFHVFPPDYCFLLLNHGTDIEFGALTCNIEQRIYRCSKSSGSPPRSSTNAYEPP